MRVCQKWFVLLGMVLLIAGYAKANSLTPPNEPKENSFYVCYERCSTDYSVRAPLLSYQKLKYIGCTINRTPCDTLYVKPHNGPPVKLRSFGWFNNYHQTMNAFYRCAYS